MVSYSINVSTYIYIYIYIYCKSIIVASTKDRRKTCCPFQPSGFHQFTSHSTRWLRRAHRVEVQGGIACVEPFARSGRGRPCREPGAPYNSGRGRPLHIHKTLPFRAILFWRCALVGKAAAQLCRLGSPLPVWVKSYSQYMYIYVYIYIYKQTPKYLATIY